MLKNYTSSVSVSRSIAHIEESLASHGAQSVIKQYSSEKKPMISFFMKIKSRDELIPFRLPVKVKQVEMILRSNMKRSSPVALKKLEEQSERTAWKIISDWIDAQMAMVELNQAELEEIFLPYMWNEKVGQSFFQVLAEKGFNLLEAPKK